MKIRKTFKYHFCMYGLISMYVVMALLERLEKDLQRETVEKAGKSSDIETGNCGVS